MGGNALKKVKTRRYEKDEYYALEKEFLDKIRSVIPNVKVEPIIAYHNKTSFGDMDIIIENMEGVQSKVKKEFDNWGVEEVYKNGDTYSINYGDFQVDLIFMEPEYFDSTLSYFSYNDIGNLLGRIARSMGFKLGHKGLNYLLMEDTNLLKDINVTNDYDKALNFLGYDSKRYREGFDDLEDMFEYVINHSHFDPAIFSLENRNHQARMRDAKRKNYRAFLQHIKDKEFPETKIVNKKSELERAFKEFPDFKKYYDDVFEKLKIKSLVKKKFNGKIVSELTKYDGVKLGLFYHYINKKILGMKDADAFFINSSQNDINNFIKLNKLQLEGKDKEYATFFSLKNVKSNIFKFTELSEAEKKKITKDFNYRNFLEACKEIGQPFSKTDKDILLFNVNTYNYIFKEKLNMDLKIDNKIIDLLKNNHSHNKYNISNYSVVLDNEYIEVLLEGLKNKKQQNSKKLKRNAIQQQNSSNLLDILNKKKVGSFICVDVEMNEKDHSQIIEIGFSFYNGKNIETKHFLVSENIDVRNGKYVPDNKDNFSYGNTMIKPLSEILEVVKEAINKSDFVIGNNVKDDIKLLYDANFCNKLDIINTNSLSNAILDTKNNLGLVKFAKELSIPFEFPHNAGNDAHVNMLLLLKSVEIYNNKNKVRVKQKLS